MSVIVVKDGWIASDSQVTAMNVCEDKTFKVKKIEGRMCSVKYDYFHKVSKIHRYLVLATGCVGDIEEFKCKFNLTFGMLTPSSRNLRDSVFIIYDKKLKIFKCWQKGEVVREIKPPFAIGSGATTANVSMDFGCNAVGAVMKARKHDPYCGGKINTIKYGD